MLYTKTKTTKIDKMRTKNIANIISMLFCTLVVLSTIGNSFAITTSFAQAQRFQAQAISTLSMTPPMATPQKNNVDPTAKTITSTNTFSNTKTPAVAHSFQSDLTLGPDTFRFINSYWTFTSSFQFPNN